MLNFKEIELNDKEIFRNFEYICSDYIFSCLYMFSELYKIRIWEDDGFVAIRSDYNNPSFYMPLGDTEYGVKKVTQYCIENNIKPSFIKIPKGFDDLFRSLNFKVEEDRNSFDYVYKNSDLASYKGKEFRKPRNNLSSYLKIYTPLYIESLNDHIEECREFTLKHYNQKNDIIYPTFRIMDKVEQLNLSGGIVLADNEIQGFCIYEKIANNVALSHVELTSNSHRGIHAYMINKMSSKINEDYINKEDDLGLLGLRRYKMTYNPFAMIKKYKALLE